MTQTFTPPLLIDGALLAARSGQASANIGPYRETETGRTPDAGIEDAEAARAFEGTSWSRPGHWIVPPTSGVND